MRRIYLTIKRHLTSTNRQACQALGCRIDYLATHDYPGHYQGNVDDVMNRLELLYNRYGKKIWLTEFAVCCTRDENAVIEFVKASWEKKEPFITVDFSYQSNF